MTRKELNKRASKISDIGLNIVKFWFTWLGMGTFIVKMLYPATAPSGTAMCIWLIPSVVGMLVSFKLEKKADEMFEKACDLPDEES